MHTRTKLLVAAALAAVAAPVASAGEFQLSAGGEYIFDSSDTEFAFTGVTVRGEYFFTDAFGVELEGMMGSGGVDNYDNTSFSFDLDKQYGAYLVGRMPAGKSGELFARAGFRAGTFDVDYSYSDPYFNYAYSDSVDYNGFSIGAGYTYFFSDTVGLRADVTTSGASLDNDFSPDGNLTSLALSLVVKFGE